MNQASGNNLVGSRVILQAQRMFLAAAP